MKLAKAIEVLDDIKDTGIDAGHYDAEEAIELGIEALKRVKEARKKVYFTTRSLLPGETEE